MCPPLFIEYAARLRREDLDAYLARAAEPLPRSSRATGASPTRAARLVIRPSLSRHSLITLVAGLVLLLASSVAFGANARHAAAQDATPAALPPLVAELQASWNAHDPERYAALFTEDGVVELGFYDEVIASGRDQIANDFAASAFASYPDVRMESRGWYETDDLLVWKWTFTGSYMGQEEGLPPGTGQLVSFAGLSVYELRDGQIARKVFVTDDLAFMEQIGFILELPEGTPTAGTPPA